METTIISTIDKLLEIEESEILIDFKPLSKCQSDLHLRSLHPVLPVFFKIQTSSPDKFHVNQPSGSLAPLSTITLQVILRPQPLPPSSFPRSSSDRFLIRSSLSPTDLNRPILISSSSSSIRLRVVYIGSYLLRLATSTGDSASVRFILRRQPQLLPLLNQTNENTTTPIEQTWSPIHVSASTGDYNNLIKLIEAGNGLQLHSRDREGRTALHVAVERGHVRCATVMIERGAEKDEKSFDGRTGLYRAAANGDAEMVAMLVELGADRTVCNDRGRLPIDVARDKGHQDVVDILERWERVMKATRRGDLRRLESLLKKRTGIRGCDQYGTTALHLAAIKGSCNVISLLIEHGMDVHTEDSEGHRALHLAVEGGCVEAIELLVGLGADVNARTKRGATPLYMAFCMRYDEIARFLLSRGAIDCSFDDVASCSDSASVSVSQVISCS